ncbi:hypothetical protein D3C86_1937100 [compost metagenome]
MAIVVFIYICPKCPLQLERRLRLRWRCLEQLDQALLPFTAQRWMKHQLAGAQVMVGDQGPGI